jgi:hypothetical protein
VGPLSLKPIVANAGVAPGSTGRIRTRDQKLASAAASRQSKEYMPTFMLSGEPT